MSVKSRKTYSIHAKKLSIPEHGKTRALWKEVFSDDTEKYLDDYYGNTALHNEIYVTVERGEPVSMLHLNSRDVCMGASKENVHFIVAVATRAQYRRQGRMRAMLCAALMDLNRRKEPFTFLTPASEKIYLPFGFYTVAKQKSVMVDRKICVKERKNQKGNLRCSPAKEEDFKELSELSGRMLAEHCMVYTDRSVSYLKRCQREQKAMEGEILLFYRENELCGYCFTGEEDGPETWEAMLIPNGSKTGVFDWEEANGQMIDVLKDYFSERLPIKVKGLLPKTKLPHDAWAKAEEKPATMARIVHLESFVRPMCAKERTEVTLARKDEILQENNGTFRFVFTPEGGSVRRIGEAKEGAVSIGELTAMFFGTEEYRSVSLAGVRVMEPVFFTELA